MGTIKDNRANIKVSPKTQALLKREGYFGETYEAIILRLLKKETKKKNKQKPSKFEENL